MDHIGIDYDTSFSNIDKITNSQFSLVSIAAEISFMYTHLYNINSKIVRCEAYVHRVNYVRRITVDFCTLPMHFFQR